MDRRAYLHRLTKGHTMEDCRTCEGDGAHPECDGAGCSDCDTGNCPTCAGTGNDPKHWHPAYRQRA